MKPLNFKPMWPQYRRQLGLMAVGLLALTGLALLGGRSQAADAAKVGAPVSSKPALSVTLTQASQSTLPIRLAANGSVAAWQEASVSAQVSGLAVHNLLVQVGDTVQRGQLLATLTSDSVQADVALARAALAEAQANATEAAANAERARGVAGSGALSAQQSGQYLTQELSARARAELAQAQLDSQLLRLKHTQLLAADAGIVSQRSASVGAVVAAGTELFRLIRQGRLEWRAELTAAELGRVKPGSAVQVSAPGGTQVTGRVRSIAPTVDAQTRNGLVYVDLPSGALAAAFKPGMFAQGEFELGSSPALVLAQSAVLLRDGFSFVMRVGTDNRVSQQKVQTGRRLGDQVEILSGLKPEDRLVAQGASFLSDGDVVRVLPSDKQNAPVAKAVSAPAASK